MIAPITRPPFIAVGFRAFLFFTATQLGICAPQPEPDQKLCTVKGLVTDAVASVWLRKAFVRLMGAGGSYPAVTDASGNFVLESVQPGMYRLEAERQGFIDAHFGDGNGTSLAIRLTPGQTLTDINIKLMPQAVITGRIVDDDGELWTHSQVSLFRSVWEHGRRRLQGFLSGNVNDGEFRIDKVPPGKYYLLAQPDAGWEARNRPRGKEAVLARQITWYPSSVDAEGATPVTVGPGDRLSGLEIRLWRGSVYGIRGMLVGAGNIPEGSAPFNTPNISAQPPDGGANARNGVIHSDGSFEIPNVPPGTYEIRVRQGFYLTLGSAKVQVDDRDIEDVSVQIIPPRPVKGMIQIDEKATPPSGIRIQLQPFAPLMGPNAISRADGSFDFQLVSSERYRVKVSPASGLYLKEIRYGDAISKDGTIDLRGAASDLVLTLSARGARLTGRVNGKGDQIDLAGGKVSTPQVVLVPNGAPGEARLAAFDQSGAFSFSDIAPGNYKLYAFEAVPDGAWEDSDFMKEVSGAGMDIQLAEGEVKSAEPPLVLASTLAATLKKLGME